jgi:hypothetical protein
MTTTIKITELTNIGANLASSTVIPVVNMAGTPTTEKTILGNIANVVLAGAGGNYVSAAKATTATTANTVLTNAQPNITSVGTLTSLTVTGNISSGNISTTNGVFTGNISGNTNGFEIGYLNIPQVAASNATLALTNAGKHFYSTTVGDLTLTVPLNASVAFATGTEISIVVQAAGNILVNAVSGVTLYMGGNATSGNRVVSTYGIATIIKVASDTWFINGTGVS